MPLDERPDLIQNPDGPGLVLYVPPGDPQVEQARTRLMLARLRTREKLQVLKAEIVTRTDWHTWYREHTAAFLLSAFFAGFLLARRH